MNTVKRRGGGSRAKLATWRMKGDSFARLLLRLSSMLWLKAGGRSSEGGGSKAAAVAHRVRGSYRAFSAAFRSNHGFRRRWEESKAAAVVVNIIGG